MNIIYSSYSFVGIKICRVANQFRGKENKCLIMYAAYAIKRNYLCSFLLLITVPFKIKRKFSYLSLKSFCFSHMLQVSYTELTIISNILRSYIFPFVIHTSYFYCTFKICILIIIIKFIVQKMSVV